MIHSTDTSLCGDHKAKEDGHGVETTEILHVFRKSKESDMYLGAMTWCSGGYVALVISFTESCNVFQNVFQPRASPSQPLVLWLGPDERAT